MSEETPVQGVVLAHGAMAMGLVDAAIRICGAEPGALVPISNDGKSPDRIQAELEERLQQGPTLIFTDLPSGSCALAARVCCRDHAELAVVFGVNLPVLLDFLFHRTLPMDELLPRLVGKGRAALTSSRD